MSKEAIFLPLIALAIWSKTACNTLPLFEDPPKERPCGIPDEESRSVRICPEGFPWCSCSESPRCARLEQEGCESGFAHIDGTCLTLEEAGRLNVSLPGNHPTCMITCSESWECDDGALCNGQEGCLEDLCMSGSNRQDGTSCNLNGNENGICRGGRCAPETCGDGHVDLPYEECDDGNEEDLLDSCQNNCAWRCHSVAECSDDDPCNGRETCDAGNHLCLSAPDEEWLVDGVSCSKSGVVGKCLLGVCVRETCGNGTIEEGEECDDKNLDSNDSCLMTCKRNTCGDGFVFAGKEECDDGNRTDGDGCDNDCMWSCLRNEQCTSAGICRECTSNHACDGTVLPDGTGCDLDGDLSTQEVCRGGSCSSAE